MIRAILAFDLGRHRQRIAFEGRIFLVDVFIFEVATGDLFGSLTRFATLWTFAWGLGHVSFHKVFHHGHEVAFDWFLGRCHDVGAG